MTNQKTPEQGGATEEEIEKLEAKIADTLAYYQCRETNPKADHPRMGYHAFPDDQREHLRAQKGEAAAEIVRMMISRPSDQHRAWEQGVKDAVSAISDSMGTLTYVAPHNPFPALSVSASAHPAGERRDVEEREAESEDHAATVTGDRESDRECPHTSKNEWRRRGSCHRCAVEAGWTVVADIERALAAPVEVDEAKLVGIARSVIDRRPYTDETRRAITGLENAIAREVAYRRPERLRGEGRC